MANDNGDDTFGLPDLNYKPLEPKKEASKPPVSAPPKTEQKTTTTQTRIQPQNIGGVKPPARPEPQGTSNSSVIIGILVPIFILVGAYVGYVYLFQKPKEKAAAELAAKVKADKEAAQKAEQERLAKEREAEEARRREAELKATPPIGTIETLSGRTGRWYVVVSSSVDDDLVMDEAQRMSQKGVSTKIIPPYGKWKYFRLTISDHDTFDLAQESANQKKGELGDGLWVMKY